MKISLVVAASKNNAIGKDNLLLWHLPKDMRFFKNTTWGLPVVMGRKTFESLGSKPLQGRVNLILTRQKGIALNGATAINSMQDAIEYAKANDYNELMVIGGGEIYAMAMVHANSIYLTRVHTLIEGDTYFPTLDQNWERTEMVQHFADEKHAFDFDFEKWQRK